MSPRVEVLVALGLGAVELVLALLGASLVVIAAVLLRRRHVVDGVGCLFLAALAGVALHALIVDGVGP